MTTALNNLDCSIFVAGHRGMVGGVIVRHLQGVGYANVFNGWTL